MCIRDSRIRDRVRGLAVDASRERGADSSPTIRCQLTDGLIQPCFGCLVRQAVGLGIVLKERGLDLRSHQRVAHGDRDGKHAQNEDQGHSTAAAWVSAVSYTHLTLPTSDLV